MDASSNTFVRLVAFIAKLVVNLHFTIKHFGRLLSNMGNESLMKDLCDIVMHLSSINISDRCKLNPPVGHCYKRGQEKNRCFPELATRYIHSHTALFLSCDVGYNLFKVVNDSKQKHTENKTSLVCTRRQFTENFTCDPGKNTQKTKTSTSYI